MPEALYRATLEISESDLAAMVLENGDLPQELAGFQFAREGPLDNNTMAAYGLPGNTGEETRATGRLMGHLREFVSPTRSGATEAEADVMAATVVHLFGDGQAVLRWMEEKFIGEFQRFVGQELGHEQSLLRADRLEFERFSDEAVGLRTLQTTDSGLVSSTIVDFRVGRLLGVAYLVSLGDEERQGLVGEMGLALESRMVRVILGAI